MIANIPRAQQQGPTFFSIGAGIGGEILGFIRAGYRFIGAWDICPAATAVLRRQYGKKGVITADINADFPRHTMPINECDLVTVALQCQCSSTNNYLRSEKDTRFDTGERMLHCAVVLRPLVRPLSGLREPAPRGSAAIPVFDPAP